MSEWIAEYRIWNWPLLAVSIGLSLLFLSLTPFRRKIAHRSSAIYVAFMVELYAEMYGFPLTLYFITSIFGFKLPYVHESGSLTLSAMPWLGWPGIPEAVMLLGLILIVLGYKKVHAARPELVTDGVYRYIRHPQYTGIILLALGLLLQWPTLPTLIMWPVLVVAYYRLAKLEEKDLEKAYGEKFLRYRQRVPMFLPFGSGKK